MTTEQFDQLLVIEDYLKRYIQKEIKSFETRPPVNETETQIFKVYQKFAEFVALNDLFLIDMAKEKAENLSDIGHYKNKNKSLMHLLQIHNIKADFLAYTKTTDF